MVPLGTLVKVTTTTGPNVIQHLNTYRSVEISGDAASGHSSGEALKAMETLAKGLPSGMGYQWVDLAYQEEQAAGKSLPVFVVVLIFVFLVIAAQFSSWLTPLAVVLAIPTGAFGVYFALWVTGQDNTIFTQVGLIAMVGLTAKNAVLIVEFAAQALAEGSRPLQAGLDGAKLRFRPIVMTSLAFVFGMLPLVFSSGAQSISRRGLGTAILGGMLVGTVLTIFVTPMLWVAIESFAQRRAARCRQAA
jgi:multidrug efflux pump subunit AcrB